MAAPNVGDLTLDELDDLSERVFQPIVRIARDLDGARQLAAATVQEIDATHPAPKQHDRMVSALVRRVVGPRYASFLSQYETHYAEYARWVPHDRVELETAFRDGATSTDAVLLYDDAPSVRAFVLGCYHLLEQMDARFRELTY